ncbi:MAG: hypothetical protein ACXAAM_06865, partial [Candidatus Heimdallarchaeaceae archaeon]
MKRKVCLSICIIVIILPNSIHLQSNVKADSYFFSLVAKTIGGGVKPDYLLIAANHLKEIGIDIEVKVEEWSLFVGDLFNIDNCDIFLRKIKFQYNDPDPSAFFSENGMFKDISLYSEVPYVHTSEALLKSGLLLTDLDLRKSIYDMWQDLFMDKILAMFPLFSRHTYEVVWSNTQGYYPNWGLINSLPYMRFDQLHNGQNSLNVFKLAAGNWRDLNPLKCTDTASIFLTNLISEPLIQINSGIGPSTFGLIDYWEQIDPNLYKFHIRNGVYWNPSYNITQRIPESNDLETAPLMIGLKGESSNGSNKLVKARDAVFTILSWANGITSQESSSYEWISDIWIDENSNSTFYIEVDGDPDTLQKEPFVQILSRLNILCLPEFFLNSTSDEISYTLGGVECRGLYDDIEKSQTWKSFSASSFGCGKYMLNYY